MYYNGIPNTLMNRLLVVIEECGHLVPVEKPTKLGEIITVCLRPLE
jgi:pimeloyl-ACP methyl ester carboxylesterase